MAEFNTHIKERMKNMKTRKNILAVVALTIMMLCASAVNTEAAVSWPSISSSKVIKAYTISTGNNTTAYSDSSLTSKTGTVYASDELYISSIGKNNKGNWFCYVSYPTVFKRRYAYLPLSAVTGASSPEAQYTSRGSITAYRRSDLKKKAGTIYKGDSIYRLSTSGNSTQIGRAHV